MSSEGVDTSTSLLDKLMERNNESNSRSVNDFESVDELKNALRSMDQPTTKSANKCKETKSSWLSEDNYNHVQSHQYQQQKPIDIISKVNEIVPLIHSQTKTTSITESATTTTTTRHVRRQSSSSRLTSSRHGHDEEAIKEELEKELRRLAILKSYRVVGSGKNPAYERLVSLASRIFKAPIAHISVLDFSKQFLLATRGLGAMASTESDRDSSICSYVVDSNHDIVVIPDLTLDNQFKDHKNVVGLPHLRFYAGCPLVCPEGVRLGTLCVLDTKARPEGFSLDMKQNLRELADMVMDVMVEERERMIFEYRQPEQMIACTSNDLMTPLRGVVEGLSTIRNDEELLNDLSSQQRELFNTAFACSTVMSRICQKSLESFHRSQKSKAEAKSKERTKNQESLLRINELVKHLHMVMNPFPKRVPLVVTVFDDVPPLIVADDLKVFRSIVNYLTNACASTETGSVHLKIYIEDEESGDEASNDGKGQKNVVFLVEDTGCGVDVDQYQFLFKPVVSDCDGNDQQCALALFGDKPAKTTKTGLGLFSVATQIGSIGGKFGFRPRGFSENGSQLLDENGEMLKGSIFWFSIPLVVPASDTAGHTAESTTIAVVESEDEKGEHTTHDKRKWNVDDEAALDDDFSHALSVGEKRTFKAFVGEHAGDRKRKALVIDDSLTTRRVLSRMLNRLGFEVSETVNGLEGLKELQANLFDLVLCDFLMPVMDGSDCVQEYRQYEVSSRPWFDQYIVGISAHANDGDVERGLKVGMNDYRAKPVTMKQLEEILEGQEFKYISARLNTIFTNVESDEATKHTKTGGNNDDESLPHSEQVRKVCLIVEEGDMIFTVAENIAEQRGWKPVVVHNGKAALRLLQMRNWDAVLIDDAIPDLSSCLLIEHFRQWEKNNRVNRQKNVYQVNSCYIPSQLESSSTMQLPTGFDGAIGKPVSLKVMKEFLHRIGDGNSCMSHDIVRR